LHFGLAAERALAAGFCKNVVVLPATDDVSIGRSRCEKVGRRGLAGNVISEYSPSLASRKVCNWIILRVILLTRHSDEDPRRSCCERREL
jgi:hypothetical protein